MAEPMTRDWGQHYKLAEKLINESYSPNTSMEERKLLVARAQVHATLATLRTNPYRPQGKLPEVFG